MAMVGERELRGVLARLGLAELSMWHLGNVEWSVVEARRKFPCAM